jgi:hypothetical protein
MMDYIISGTHPRIGTSVSPVSLRFGTTSVSLVLPELAMLFKEKSVHLPIKVEVTNYRQLGYPRI